MTHKSELDAPDDLVQLAALVDRCVKCGMCLPYCPTYRKNLVESESPRGRLSLIQGLISGELAITPHLITRLDNCLKCRTCEDICPSTVPYGRIIDAIQGHIESHYKRSLRSRLLRHIGLWLVEFNRSALPLLVSSLRFYQRSGLRRLVHRTGVLKLGNAGVLEKLLPTIPPRQHWQEYYPPSSPKQGEVALFTGCIARTIDQQTLLASIRVLTRLGYGVHVPNTQVCCGALHLHNGAPRQAYSLASKNLLAFAPFCTGSSGCAGSSGKIDAIISTASGCGLCLSEYPDLPNLCASDRDLARTFAGHITDISTFINKIAWPQDLPLRPLHKAIAIHSPCSLRNILHQETEPHTLLQKIPAITLHQLTSTTTCCGAAGSYFITHTNMANRLRADTLAELDRVQFETLVTSNIGCALHLAAGLREHGLTTEVVHPVVVLERQM